MGEVSFLFIKTKNKHWTDSPFSFLLLISFRRLKKRKKKLGHEKTTTLVVFSIFQTFTVPSKLSDDGNDGRFQLFCLSSKHSQKLFYKKA